MTAGSFVLALRRQGVEKGTISIGKTGAHDKAHEPMNDSERKILMLCSEQPKSAGALLKALGYETRTGNFKRAIAHLLEAGALEMSIPDKPTSKKQKYRLTDKGRNWLDE